MARVILDKKRLRRDFIRHPWVYKNSVSRIEVAEGEAQPEDGALLPLYAPDGKFIAYGFLNRNSRLYLRILSFLESDSDPEAVILRRIREAIALRRDILKLNTRADAWRVIHSEADGLPGLIVDRYGSFAVLSCTSLATYRFVDAIAALLMSELELRGVFEVGASKGLRGIEGLPPGRGVIAGEAPPDEQILSIDGLQQRVRISGGQKTGLFLDQRDNIALFANTCAGETVLDACCYGASFSIAALQAGARSALAFDASEKAIANATGNAELNQVQERLELRRADLYEELRRLRQEGRRFSRIALDPPNFAGTRKDLTKARKAYTEAHNLALQVLEPGGLLATFTCSHHVSEELLEQSLAEASRRQGLRIQILQRLGAGPDHPQDIDCPEGRYLKGLLVRVLA